MRTLPRAHSGWAFSLLIRTLAPTNELVFTVILCTDRYLRISCRWLALCGYPSLLLGPSGKPFPGKHRENMYLTSLPLVSVRRHGHVTRWNTIVFLVQMHWTNLYVSTYLGDIEFLTSWRAMKTALESISCSKCWLKIRGNSRKKTRIMFTLAPWNRQSADGSTDNEPTVNRLSVDSRPMGRLTMNRQSTDCRSTVGRWVDWQWTDCWSLLVDLAADCRLTVGHYSLVTLEESQRRKITTTKDPPW